jgi:hypothetical protein
MESMDFFKAIDPFPQRRRLFSEFENIYQNNNLMSNEK